MAEKYDRAQNAYTMHLPLLDIAELYFTLQAFFCFLFTVWALLRCGEQMEMSSRRAGDGVEEPAVAHHSQ